MKTYHKLISEARVAKFGSTAIFDSLTTVSSNHWYNAYIGPNRPNQLSLRYIYAPNTSRVFFWNEIDKLHASIIREFYDKDSSFWDGETKIWAGYVGKFSDSGNKIDYFHNSHYYDIQVIDNVIRSNMKYPGKMTLGVFKKLLALALPLSSDIPELKPLIGSNNYEKWVTQRYREVYK